MSPENNANRLTNGYDSRQEVPSDYRDWTVDYPDYSPVDFTSNIVLTTGAEQGWADPELLGEVDFSLRSSFLGEVNFDKESGRPLNPMGRQGLGGRGELGKWGVNNAADPIVIAKESDGSLKILLIRRKDTQQWALPGGMVNPGEHVSLAAKRELNEEAGIDLSEVPAMEVARGYVDDPRNTDNAWIETVASCMVIDFTPETQSGDDATETRWFELTDIESLRKDTRITKDDESYELYASHDQLIQMALDYVHGELS